MEGIWTGLRNFLRPFRGMTKRLLSGYIALLQWAHHLKAVTDNFLRTLLGIKTTSERSTAGDTR